MHEAFVIMLLSVVVAIAVAVVVVIAAVVAVVVVHVWRSLRATIQGKDPEKDSP